MVISNVEYRHFPRKELCLFKSFAFPFRATVENRLANVHSASPQQQQQQGQSFLARQRQVGRNHPSASSNVVKNEFLDY